jgi:predicted RNA-binding protein
MCLAKVRLNGGKEDVFKDVTTLHFEDGMIRLRTLFGEEKELAGRVREINFLDAVVLLETTV